ncbi:hypothetical protein MC885_001515, partial [Smutsia gigantea]
LFGLDIKGRDCGDEAARWFTDFLKSEAFRVVQFEKDMKGRPSREILPPFVQNYQVAYPDCSPIMVLSEASLADLNTRLEKKVKMDHFRPNIVVTGCDAFEEDTWDELLIGSVEMKKILSCPRCIMTTVDPDTGVIDRKEPLETLKSGENWKLESWRSCVSDGIVTDPPRSQHPGGINQHFNDSNNMHLGNFAEGFPPETHLDFTSVGGGLPELSDSDLRRDSQ